MADKLSYPQIPSTVWWGVRNLLQRSPNATIDERALGVELNVQEVAARQYVVELKRVGILKGNLSHGIWGFGCLKCRCGGIDLFCSASTTLISPATPAADSA